MRSWCRLIQEFLILSLKLTIALRSGKARTVTRRELISSSRVDQGGWPTFGTHQVRAAASFAVFEGYTTTLNGSRRGSISKPSVAARRIDFSLRTAGLRGRRKTEDEQRFSPFPTTNDRRRPWFSRTADTRPWPLACTPILSCLQN